MHNNKTKRWQTKAQKTFTCQTNVNTAKAIQRIHSLRNTEVTSKRPSYRHGQTRTAVYWGTDKDPMHRGHQPKIILQRRTNWNSCIMGHRQGSNAQRSPATDHSTETDKLEQRYTGAPTRIQCTAITSNRPSYRDGQTRTAVYWGTDKDPMHSDHQQQTILQRRTN